MTTATPPTIFERMAAILKDLPPIGKDQKNTQQNFMFRGHDDVLNALNPLLAKHGVFVLPHVLARETSQRTTAKGSVMFEVSLLVEYTFHGAGGDSVRGSAWGEGTDMGDKATSKAMTMAFKSVLNQGFAISNKEVADADAQTPDETHAAAPRKPAAAASAAEVKEGLAKLDELKTLAATWKTLHPEFDPATLDSWLEKPRSAADLDTAIAAYKKKISDKTAEADSDFQVPAGARSAA